MYVCVCVCVCVCVFQINAVHFNFRLIKESYKKRQNVNIDNHNKCILSTKSAY